MACVPMAGQHILSGNVFEPRALDELIPDWQERNAPVHSRVVKDRFYYLTKRSRWRLPVIPDINNHGNYIISLGKLCHWLGQQAEALGVEIYSGIAARHVLYNEDGSVRGVATGDMGIGKDGKRKDNFERGMALYAKQTILAEGCRGSLSKEVMKRFDLRKDSQPQTYGIGLKEVCASAVWMMS